MAVKKVLCLGGFKSVGKSYWARYLGAYLNIEVIDIDRFIEKQLAKSIRDVFKEIGEPGFQELEYEIISLLDFSKPSIISLGGGALLHKPILDLLVEKSSVVILDNSFETVRDRILNQSSLWPKLDPNNPHQSLKELFNLRQNYYKSLKLPIFNMELSQQIKELEGYAREFFW